MQQLRALDIRFILCDLSVDMKSPCKLFHDLPEGNFELSFWASNYIVIQDDWIQVFIVHQDLIN